VIDATHIGVETTLGVIAVERGITTDVMTVAAEDPHDLVLLLALGFLPV
jgi:hypothetical protein